MIFFNFHYWISLYIETISAYIITPPMWVFFKSSPSGELSYKAKKSPANTKFTGLSPSILYQNQIIIQFPEPS